jgi:hypothetical protein
MTATVEHFIIQNGFSDTGGTGIINYGNLTLLRSIVRNNQAPYGAWGAGITNYWMMMVAWSTISGNQCINKECHGGGIYNWAYAKELIIANSTISGNLGSKGGGIYTGAIPVKIVNTTISGNEAWEGGGIYNEGGQIKLNNTTITDNEGTDIGGGIFTSGHFDYDKVLIQDTIVAGNTGNIAPDCAGPVTSAGYNLIGEVGGCTFGSKPSDQIGIDPLLGPLGDSGGPTQTHFLYAGSSAIDAGNPSGCNDPWGNLLTIDQRGHERPFDGNGDSSLVCDIGAFEVDNNPPLPPPATIWYVSTTGNDGNDCQSAVTPCGTINGAIAKAAPGDSVQVGSGTYTGNGENVVIIDKNLNLSGGWNETFTSQTGTSTIDGQSTRRGIKVEIYVITLIDRFVIEHGFNDTDNEFGGGIFIPRATVTLESGIIRDNQFSGISVGNHCMVTLKNSVVTANRAERGAGIINGNSLLILNGSAVTDNHAMGDGGGIYSRGEVILNNSLISGNTLENSNEDGGGIFLIDGKLSAKNSTITNNIATGTGGGIYGYYDLFIEHSLISDNQAINGGGIGGGRVRLTESTIVGNAAIEHGGGIWNSVELVSVNSTINGNTAGTEGGGIYDGTSRVYNSTISQNSAAGSGGGVARGGIIMQNTILAENIAPQGPNCANGSIMSEGYNLIGNKSGCAYEAGSGDMVNTKSGLGLTFGWPPVLPLLPESPAIDTGNPDGCKDIVGNPISKDQLGTNRPLDGDGDGETICDIGAYEYNPAHPIKRVYLPLSIYSSQPAEGSEIQ